MSILICVIIYRVCVCVCVCVFACVFACLRVCVCVRLFPQNLCPGPLGGSSFVQTYKFPPSVFHSASSLPVVQNLAEELSDSSASVALRTQDVDISFKNDKLCPDAAHIHYDNPVCIPRYVNMDCVCLCVCLYFNFKI